MQFVRQLESVSHARMPDIRRLVNQISLESGGKQKALKKLRKKMKKRVAKLKKMLKNNVGSYLWHTIVREMLLDLKVSRRIKVRYGGRKFIIKPTNWGLGLFAGETIPKNTRLTSDKFPFGKRYYIKVKSNRIPNVDSKSKLKSFVRKHVPEPLREHFVSRINYLYAAANVDLPKGESPIENVPEKEASPTTVLSSAVTYRPRRSSRSRSRVDYDETPVHYVLIEDPFDYPFGFSNSCTGKYFLPYCNVRVEGPEAIFKTTRQIESGEEILWDYPF